MGDVEEALAVVGGLGTWELTLIRRTRLFQVKHPYSDLIETTKIVLPLD